MILGFQTLVALNITLQIVLILAMAGSIYLAKKKSLKKHCATMRLVVPVQILAIFAIMLPAMSRYVDIPAVSTFLVSELWIHHALGLGVIVLWVYINLVYLKHIKPIWKLKLTMHMAAACWILSLILGLHTYWQLYH